jgi:hypothetical protein
VRTDTNLGDEGASPKDHQLDAGGFPTNNEDGERERKPRFCGMPDETVHKAAPCG